MGYFDVQAGIGVSPFFQPHSCFPAVGILQSRWLPCSRSLNCFWYFENSQIVLIESGFLCSGLIIANTSKRNYLRFSHHYLQMDDKHVVMQISFRRGKPWYLRHFRKEKKCFCRSLNFLWYFENSQIVLIDTGFLYSGLIIANTSKGYYLRFLHHY